MPFPSEIFKGLSEGENNLGSIVKLYLIPAWLVNLVPEPAGAKQLIDLEDLEYIAASPGWINVGFTYESCFLKVVSKTVDAGTQFTYTIEFRKAKLTPEKRFHLERMENTELLVVAVDGNDDAILIGSIINDERYGMVLTTEYASGSALKDRNSEVFVLKAETLQRFYHATNISDMPIAS